MKHAIILLLALQCSGCAALGSILGSPAGQAAARAALDIVHGAVTDRLAASKPGAPAPEFCIGEWDERVCYAHSMDSAAELIRRDFEERGADPDTANTQCFDAAEEAEVDGVTGHLCHVPEAGW